VKNHRINNNVTTVLLDFQTCLFNVVVVPLSPQISIIVVRLVRVRGVTRRQVSVTGDEKERQCDGHECEKPHAGVLSKISSSIEQKLFS
jgi:hypothetical protein